MNYEESRLRTFRSWPTNAPVDARRIAKAGFYYMGQDLEVQCFSCGGRISEWNYNDKVMTRHRALDPNCPFVLSPALSGNVPFTSRPNEGHSSNTEEITLHNRPAGDGVLNAGSIDVESNQDQMYDEAARLNTYVNWPISFIVSPQSLSKAGFYYLQQGDKVSCPFCSVIIGRWETGDNPLEEHKRHSPGCSFLQSYSCRSVPDSVNSLGITFREGLGACSDSIMKSLGVQNHRVAKHPKYTSKDSRLATYQSWPQDTKQTPDDLAEAGFYYLGSGDQVRCFHCDGGLGKWDPNDDPWVEHARWFPDCGFVMLIKGETFINDSIHQRPPVFPEFSSSTDNKVTRTRSTRVSEDELSALMSSPIATTALQIGLDLSRVKMAIRQKLEQTGLPFSTADDLIEATLDIQLDEVPYQDTEETWSTPLNSPVRQRPVNVMTVLQLLSQQASLQDASDSSEAENSKIQRLDQSIKPVNEVSVAPTLTDNDTEFCDKKGTKTLTLEEENRRLREARLCKICMDSEVCIVFLPCSHLVTCVSCAQSLAACPVCRHNIKATVRTFLS
uniref:RING-type domain-containing protein n=1 Tax=Homalodisca liturata TaxID=320908 RepID=A0A1B6IHN5_9HEMI